MSASPRVNYKCFLSNVSVFRDRQRTRIQVLNTIKVSMPEGISNWTPEFVNPFTCWRSRLVIFRRRPYITLSTARWHFSRAPMGTFLTFMDATPEVGLAPVTRHRRVPKWPIKSNGRARIAGQIDIIDIHRYTEVWFHGCWRHHLILIMALIRPRAQNTPEHPNRGAGDDKLMLT